MWLPSFLEEGPGERAGVSGAGQREWRRVHVSLARLGDACYYPF